MIFAVLIGHIGEGQEKKEKGSIVGEVKAVTAKSQVCP